MGARCTNGIVANFLVLAFSPDLNAPATGLGVCAAGGTAQVAYKGKNRRLSLYTTRLGSSWQRTGTADG